MPLYLHPNSARLGWPVFEGRTALTYAWTAGTGAHALRLICSGLFDLFPTVEVILDGPGGSRRCPTGGSRAATREAREAGLTEVPLPRFGAR
ncbi:hypothetical protein ACFRQM_50170 [Streptomyces sp. NPDC056831]|uniref:hypothetical protein n=1 Tax=Streptomyces sp. NPDC056831 TaxID=3345954 RepID=UPI0036988015